MNASVSALDSLDEIGRRYGTDKSGEKHDYLGAYEAALTPYRASARCVIEIGVFRGASLRMWRDFFPNAQIIGLDIQEILKRHEDDRIAIEIGDQQDGAFLLGVVQKYGTPDIIIDDGSHHWAHQIASFRHLYSELAPGGVYIIEDLHTSRAERYGEPGAQTAASYLSGLAAGVAADGKPWDGEDSGFGRYVRAWSDQIIFGRRYCMFRKKIR